MKSLFIDELQEGMVVGKDIYTSQGIMIISAGVVITEPIINHLVSLGIYTVDIDDTAVVRDYVRNEKEQKEFEEFSKKYTSVEDELQNTINKIVDRNIDRDDVERIIDSSWKMLSEEHNSYNMINLLYSMSKYSDSTYTHCMNVGMIAALLGRWLGWSKEDIKILNACGMFHDIGKLVIDRDILNKPDKLTDEEYRIIKNHTVEGYKLIKDSELDRRIINATIMHHERCDGSGYPFGLKGDKIDEFSKIIAIADVYDAMTARRVYRLPICPFDVVAQFEKTGFEQFEAKYLFVFLENIVDSYLHANVRLNNGEKAEIVLINKNRGSKPVVLTSAGRPIDLSKEPEIKIEEVYA